MSLERHFIRRTMAFRPFSPYWYLLQLWYASAWIISKPRKASLSSQVLTT